MSNKKKITNISCEFSEFNYLAEKIKNAKFLKYPFKHIIIDNFFSEDHFNKIIDDNQIKLPEYNNNFELIDSLLKMGYIAQPFPGCITNLKKYLNYLEDPKKNFERKSIPGYGKNTIEGFGMTMRLKNIKSEFLKNLYCFLNSDYFIEILKKKFQISDKVKIETAYQKNLTGYEISPHPDTRHKALTYMVNIYTHKDALKEKIHTRFLTFKDRYRYIYEYWKYGDKDRRWVPWDWCEEISSTNTNNSISIFKPNFDTLHAVKLNYDHLKYQRNQIYGNLWYEGIKCQDPESLYELDLFKKRSVRGTFNELKDALHEKILVMRDGFSTK